MSNDLIIHVRNIKTGKPQQFTQKQWDEAGKKGFHTKFEIVDKRQAMSPGEKVEFQPDEIAEKVKGIVIKDSNATSK